ncbi:MAG: tetratricopeptide repeat protein [Candidatus Omnitrophota bacterium]
MQLKTLLRIDKEDFIPILLVFSLALIARFFYLIDYSKVFFYPLLPYSDSYAYLSWAKDIAYGKVIADFAFMKWPLYAYFLSFLYKILFNNISLIYYFQFLLGALNCVLVYLIAKILFNRAVAFFASLVCVWYAIFIFYEGLLVYTALSLLLNSLFFLLFLIYKDRLTLLRLLGLGILLGICTLTQGNIIIFGILAIIGINMFYKQSRKGLIAGFSLFLAGLFMVLGLATLHNYLAEKDFLLLQGNTGINFYFGNNPQSNGLYHELDYFAPSQENWFRDSRVLASLESGRELKTSEVENYWFNRALNYIKGDPKRYMALAIKKFFYIFSGNEYVHDKEFAAAKKAHIFRFFFFDLRFILPLALLGMVSRIREYKKLFLLYLAVVVFSLSIVPFYINSRYRITIVPFLAIFAAYGFFNLINAIKAKRHRYYSMLVLFLLVFSWLVNFNPLFLGSNSVSSRVQSFNTHYFLAQEYYQRKDLLRVLQELNTASLLNPKSKKVLFFQGVVYFELEKLNEAEGKFKAALEVYPLEVDAYQNLGLIYLRQNRLGEAKEMFKKVISLDPKDIAAHFEMGRIYKQKGDFAKAEKELNFVLQKINPWRTEEIALIKNDLLSLKK